VSQSRRDELSAVIVDSIKSCPYSRRDVDRIVRSQVDVLIAVLANEPSFGRQAENKRHGGEIEQIARQLQRKFKGMPEGTLRALSVLSAYSGQPLPPADKVDFAMVERYEVLLLSTLKALEAGAHAMRENKIGDYHTLDRKKHFCAATGFELLVGLKANRPTNGDPFRLITNSLFEIVAPDEVRDWQRRHKERPDLRAQCEKVLANWLSDPAHLDSHTERLRLEFAGMIGQKSSLSL
jgi:hypothetical protein